MGLKPGPGYWKFNNGADNILRNIPIPKLNNLEMNCVMKILQFQKSLWL